MRDYLLGGTQVAFDAIEAIRRQLSVELGPHGIRVVTLASGGVPESLPDGFEANRGSAAVHVERELSQAPCAVEDGDLNGACRRAWAPG